MKQKLEMEGVTQLLVHARGSHLSVWV